jgi:hypothetical protein
MPEEAMRLTQFYDWVREFNKMILGIYKRRIGKQVLERKIQFFSKLAEDAYKASEFFIPIPPVSAKDFENYNLNEKSYKWLKAILPPLSLNPTFLKELASNAASNSAKSRLSSRLTDLLELLLDDMSRGRPTNIPFVLSLEKLFFDLVGENIRFVEDDLLGNARRFRQLYINLQNLLYEPLQQEEFEGVRYSVNPAVEYDFAEVEKEDVVSLGDLFRNYDGVDSVELEGEPIKTMEVLSEPALILPLSVVDNEFLSWVLKESLNIEKEEAKSIKTLVRSVFLKQERWCLYLDGTTLRFIVPKETVLLKSRDPVRRSGSEHQS